jgi:hypothetical protein
MEPQVILLSRDLKLLDLLQQRLGLALCEVLPHGLQDAVDGLSHGGLQVTGVHLAGPVVLLEPLVFGVLHRALQECCEYKEVRYGNGRLIRTSAKQSSSNVTPTR